MLRKSIVFLFLAFFTANASDPAQDNTKTVVYVHPVALLYGLNIKSIVIYSTIEMPLSLYNAPIIKPSVWIGSGKYTGSLRVGSDFGFRHYLAGRGEGLYLQPQAGAFYFVTKDWPGTFDFEPFHDSEYKKGTWFDGMLYLGNAYKFRYMSIYMDTGIGYACAFGVCSLIYDSNIGVGISF